MPETPGGPESLPLLDRLRPLLAPILARYRIPPEPAKGMLVAVVLEIERRPESPPDPATRAVRALTVRCRRYWRDRRRAPAAGKA